MTETNVKAPDEATFNRTFSHHTAEVNGVRLLRYGWSGRAARITARLSTNLVRVAKNHAYLSGALYGHRT